MLPSGIRHLPEFLDRAAQEALVEEIRLVVAAAPLYVPTMPRTGKPMSVRMTNCGALGWVTGSCDGHDPAALEQAFDALLAGPPDRPKLLVALTVKGAGIAHLEGRTESHFPPPVSADDIALACYRPTPHRLAEPIG